MAIKENANESKIHDMLYRVRFIKLIASIDAPNCNATDKDRAMNMSISFFGVKVFIIFRKKDFHDTFASSSIEIAVWYRKKTQFKGFATFEMCLKKWREIQKIY
jgi:hypothetical protein